MQQLIQARVSFRVGLMLLLLGWGGAMVDPVNAAAESGASITFELHPPAAFVDQLRAHPQPMPFYQAIPLAQGELRPHDGALALTCQGEPIPAQVRPTAYWPDGSVRWLAVDGVWPGDVALNAASPTVELRLSPQEAKERPAGERVQLRQHEGQLELVAADGRRLAVLEPSASVLTIDQPQPEGGEGPDYWDEQGQFLWAASWATLGGAAAEPAPLAPRVRDFAVEEDHAVFTVYRVRGDGGPTLPGRELEWQLRVRVYHAAELATLQMTWSAHWDENRYALAGAKWRLRMDEALQRAELPGAVAVQALRDGAVVRYSDARGASRVTQAERELLALDGPDERLHAWLIQQGTRHLGLATPLASRLGPNHVAVDAHGIELAAWSDREPVAMDLRRTVEADSFGMSSIDGRSTARGLSRTVEASLAWANQPAAAAALAQVQARRDGLWFPSTQDLVRTAAIEPWKPLAGESVQAYLAGLQANLHFLLASRDRWRWNGYINYGDVRTNFAYGTNPERGLYRLRWSLNGRYGWRNGAGQPYQGMAVAGLYLNDRALLLAALDYAMHVADVDVYHASFFAPPEQLHGGMHRRNKDHWSGSVQMQYTPSSGLYLMHRLSGQPRLAETLEEIRGFAERDEGRGNSAFAASAWINHYAQTRDPAHLAKAVEMLDRTAQWWHDHAKVEQPASLADLYTNNFRRTLDGFPVLIEFHKVTGDARYLDAIAESIRRHGGLPEEVHPNLASCHAAAYLLAVGVPETVIGADSIAHARQAVSAFTPPPLDPPSAWTYDNLAHIVTELLPPARSPAYRESASIGWRAVATPLVLQQFGPLPAAHE